MKRRMKKEKAKIIKEAHKKSGGLKLPAGDGTFLEKVKQKYGDDALIERGGEDKSESES